MSLNLLGLPPSQVLAHPRSRQLYDLARDRSGPGVLRAAAASGVSGATYEEVQVRCFGGAGPPSLQPAAWLSETCAVFQHHSQHRSSAMPAQVDLSWGLGRLFQQPPAGSSAALDQVRQELQT